MKHCLLTYIVILSQKYQMKQYREQKQIFNIISDKVSAGIPVALTPFTDLNQPND